MSTIRLNLLGRFAIRRDPGEVLDLPTRKSVVLLAYLALNAGEPVPRERLSNLLWSERSDEQARNSLRHALSTLRKRLGGPPILQSTRSTVTLGTQALEVDALELENALAKGAEVHVDDIVRLCRGEFLEGIEIRDPTGEQWLAEIRRRFHRTTSIALESACVRRREDGDLEGAVSTGEKLVDHDPLNEAAWRMLMCALADRGQRNQALEVYERCRATLHQELAVEPQAQTLDLASAIRHGVLREDDAPTSDDAVNPSGKCAVLPRRGASGKPCILVVPLTASDSQDSDLSEGLTENLIIGLCRYRELLVIARDSAFVYRDLGISADEFARAHEADYLVQGSVRRSASQLRISVQLADTAGGLRLWAQQFDRPVTDLFALEDDIVSRVIASLVNHVERTHVAAHRSPTDVSAFERVARARRDVWSHDHDENAVARQMLEQAIELDPDYAPAYAYLAYAHLAEADAEWSTARNAAIEDAADFARKALELDEYDSRGHVALAAAMTYLRHYETAERHFDRAIECNPNEYDAYCFKGWLLAFMGRTSEVMVCNAAALRMCPMEPDDCLLPIAIAGYLEGRYRDALSALARMHEPDDSALMFKAACLTRLGDEKAALKVAAAVRRRQSLSEWLIRFPFRHSRNLDLVVAGMRGTGAFTDL